MYVGKDQVVAYLLEKAKSYNGYPFISIAASGAMYKDDERKNLVPITVHRTIPTMNDRGRYISDKDHVVEVIKVDDLEFKGIVIDKHGNGIIGNPFAPIVNSQIPNLGEESAKIYGEVVFGDDEQVETI
jgi:hypothetical protein